MGSKDFQTIYQKRKRMLKSYLKTAIRHLSQNRVYSFINIFGLSIGIATAILIFMIVKFELSFDNFHNRSEDIYRIVTKSVYNGVEDYTPGTPLPMRQALSDEFPDLEEVALISIDWGVQVDANEQDENNARRVREDDGVFFAEPSFFRIFNFPWKVGRAESALSQPNQVAISESTAKKYFGTPDNAMGKTLRLNQKHVFRVSGIFYDPPFNSDFPIKIVLPQEAQRKIKGSEEYKDWGSIDSDDQLFVRLPASVSQETLKEKLDFILGKYQPEDKEEANTHEYLAQPFQELHYDNRINSFTGRVIPYEIIGALILVAIFLLVIACINFVNLATAQAVNRSREVGIRKVLGSTRGALVSQFMWETFFLVSLASLLSLCWVNLFLPYVADLVILPLKFNILEDFSLLFYLFFQTVFISLIAGLYPALVMARFKPVLALKNKLSRRIVGGVNLRQGLVVLQFIIAQVLIIAFMVAISQMRFVSQISLGFDKEAIVSVDIPEDGTGKALTPKLEIFRQELSRVPGLEHFSFCNRPPSSGSIWHTNFELDGRGDNEDFRVNAKFADTAYIPTFDIELLAGRVYENSDTITEVVINETFMRDMGFKKPEDALNQKGHLSGYRVSIVGVMKDFHLTSLHEQIEASVLCSQRSQFWELAVKLQADRFQEQLAEVKKVYTLFYPDHVFEYEFLDERLADSYDMEQRLMKTFQFFALIGIFISCLGLYGLVSYMAAQRSKEVGIRKVMGASFLDICLIFFKEFIWLVILAFMIASPLAWLVMKSWLENFAYRVSLNPLVFIATGLGVMVVALLTISSKAFIAARVNPVEVLRDE